MPAGSNSLLAYLRRLAARRDVTGRTDRDLLGSFAENRDQGAFAELVRRHGPMVLAACRRILANPHDAEDAFQAVFLVLARKAATLPARESVAGWLFEVARRVALEARGEAVRWHARSERPVRPVGGPAPDPLAEVSGRELCSAVDDELGRLPPDLRGPLVLCYLEGVPRDEAAGRLGVTLGTLKRRLAEGRDVLRDRLARRGLAPAALLGLLAASASAPAAVPAAVVRAVARAAETFLTPESGGVASERILTLVSGVTKAMTTTTVRNKALTLLSVLFVLAAGAGLASRFHGQPSAGAEARPEQPPRKNDEPKPPSDETTKAQEREEMAALQGTWKLASRTIDDRDPQSGRIEKTWVLKEGKSTMRWERPDDKGPGNKGESLFDFTFDAAKSPKEMTFSGGQNKLVMIYKLEKDTLTLAWFGKDNGLRPKGFTLAEAGAEDKMLIVEVLKRQNDPKPPEEKPGGAERQSDPKPPEKPGGAERQNDPKPPEKPGGGERSRSVGPPAGAEGAGERARVTVGPNAQVSKSLSELGHAECVVAADPKDSNRLVVGSMYDPKGFSLPKVVGYYSRDGGKTWEVAFERKDDPDAMGADPAAAFGPDGSAYFVSMSFPRPEEAASPEEEAKLKLPKFGDEGVGAALVVARSADGGKTWEELPGIKRFIDRPWLAVDCSAAATRGRLYCSGSTGQPVLYASDNGGKSFGAPQAWAARLPYRSFGIGNPVVLADGTLVVLYNGYLERWEKKGTPYLAVRRSTDGGKSFGDERLVGDWHVGISPGPLGIARLAAGPGGDRQKDHLYAVWTDEAPGGLRVMFSRSADKGLTWSKPVPLSEQPEPKPGEKAYGALIPSVAVNNQGVVSVTWYDRRGLTGGGKGWNVRLRASLDGGENWLPSVQVNDVGSEKRDTASLGHTAGLAADADGVFHPVWIDNRMGTLQVWTAAVTVAPTKQREHTEAGTRR
jgi:RNA polymerase sigma factor (sigma-70 family)